jgi:hypothetical protein
MRVKIIRKNLSDVRCRQAIHVFNVTSLKLTTLLRPASPVSFTPVCYVSDSPSFHAGRSDPAPKNLYADPDHGPLTTNLVTSSMNFLNFLNFFSPFIVQGETTCLRKNRRKSPVEEPDGEASTVAAVGGNPPRGKAWKWRGKPGRARGGRQPTNQDGGGPAPPDGGKQRVWLCSQHYQNGKGAQSCTPPCAWPGN